MKIVIWGTGRKTRELEKKLRDGINVIAYIESEKKGEMYNGKRIMQPDEISESDYDFIIVSPLCAREIMDKVYELNIDESKVIPIYIFQLNNIVEYWRRYSILCEIVEYEWVRSIVEEQWLYDRLFDYNFNLHSSSDLSSCDSEENSVSIDGLKHSIWEDFNRFIIEDDKTFFFEYNGVKILPPIGWSKKKFLLSYCNFLQSNQIGSVTRTTISEMDYLKGALFLGEDIVLPICDCVKRDFYIYVYENNVVRANYLSEIFEQRNNVVIVRDLSTVFDKDICAVRCDYIDITIIKEIVSFIHPAYLEVININRCIDLEKFEGICLDSGYRVSYFGDILDPSGGKKMIGKVNKKKKAIVLRKNST